MWNLKDLWNFHAGCDCSIMLMCFIYAFFVLQLFELSIFDLASVLVCLLSLSPWAFHPLLLCHCFMGKGGGLCHPPAPAITQNLPSIDPFDFFQMCHVLTSISLKFHSQTLKLLFVLPLVSPLVSLWLVNPCPCYTCGHFVFASFWTFLFGRSSSSSVILILFILINFTFESAYMVPCPMSAVLGCLHKFHSQNSRASHDLHMTTLCCKEIICWHFKDVTY